MTKKKLAYALTEKKTGKVCWIGLERPRKEGFPDGVRWYMFDGYTLLVSAHKLSRIKISIVK